VAGRKERTDADQKGGLPKKKNLGTERGERGKKPFFICKKTFEKRENTPFRGLQNVDKSERGSDESMM